MNRAQALAILALPRADAVTAILALGEKAEQWDRLQAQGATTSISPTTPSGMQPVYLKPSPKRRAKKPGRKPGHPGACRPVPEHIDAQVDHPLTSCPRCGTTVGEPIRAHTRIIEDIPQVTPLVTAHTVHGYWCGTCKTIVTPTLTAALPRASLGLHFVAYTAWLHYFIGVSVGNCVTIAQASWGFTVSPGGLTQAWKNFATLLEADYERIGEQIRAAAVLCADETGWRINGVTCWLWAFATQQYCYYVIERHRGTQVVTQVLGTLFAGILITDFWGAYNAIETLAKQRCYFHLFTELIKVDHRNGAPDWQRFRKRLSRLLKDAVRLGAARNLHPPPIYARRKAKLHQRLDALIAATFNDADAQRLIKRLRRHRHELLTFLNHDNVSPYNNHAEQQMRTAVHTRKVSQQNRSDLGAKTHAILLSHFRSAHLQKLNPLDHVMQLAKAAIAGQSTATPSTIPLKQAA
ncbi:MAG: IS66 family transposase [Gammaproteobacteria bacterium]